MAPIPKPRRTHVCDMSTQVRGYDIDVNFDSTFGSVFNNSLNDVSTFVDLAEVNDDLLCCTNSFSIPVIANNSQSRQNSNFHSGDRTLGT